MVDVNPELLVAEIAAEIAGGIHVKFQRNPLTFELKNMVGRIIVLYDVRVSEKSKMAACKWKSIWI